MKRLVAIICALLGVFLLAASPAHATGSRTTDAAPLYGGDQIQKSSGGMGKFCTGWFTMHHGVNGSYSGTAEPCYVGTYQIGSSGSIWGLTDTAGGGVSAGAQLDKLHSKADNHVYADPTTNNRDVRSWSTTNAQDVLGALLCVDSESSGETCNMPVTNSDITAVASDGTSWTHQVQVRCPVANIECISLTDNRDMGAPVYSIYTGTQAGKVNAVGMLVATDVQCTGSTCWQYGYYSPARYVMAWYQSLDPGINILCDLCTDS